MTQAEAKRIVDAQTARDVAFLEAFRLLSARAVRRKWGSARPTVAPVPWHVTIRRYRPTGEAGSSRT